jgi:hypothetical protein
MGMKSDSNKKRTRKLYDWEIEEFTPVFGNTLIFVRIRIHEGTTWPDFLDRLGRKLKGMTPPSKESHNAMTLGNHCYFPVNLPEFPVPLGHPDSYKLDWLVHELTHSWQFQHIGWKYLIKALRAQFRDKQNAYEYGGRTLRVARKASSLSTNPDNKAYCPDLLST